MTKYRIRFPGGRVIGPFEKQQLFDLKAKGQIKGGEEAQLFPTGNWEPISSFEFYSDLMDENKTRALSTEANEGTFVIDLAKLRNKKNEIEIEALVKEPVELADQLTETVRLETADQKKVSTEGTNVTVSQNEIVAGSPEKKKVKEIEVDDKTSINPVAQQEIQKIQREQKEAQAKLEAEQNLKRLADEQAMKFELEVAKENELVSSVDSTQVIVFEKTELLTNANEAEVHIDQELKEFINKQEKEELKNENQYNALVQKAKKKKIVIILAVIAICYAIFFPDEKAAHKKFVHLDPQIEFPIPFDVVDGQRSKILFSRGVSQFTKGTYPSLIKAGLSFKESYENDLNNYEALGYLVRSYGEQLKHSNDKLVDAQTVFNIIQSKRSLLIQDTNGVIGMNLFYLAINKPDAAIDVIQKYLKLKPNEITQDLFAIYLQSLVKRGRLDQAKQFYNALLKAPGKNRYTYVALIEYLILNEEADKALEFATEAIKKYPSITALVLLKAGILINQHKADAAVPFLKKAEAMNVENNNINRAKLYELKGLYYVLKNKPKEAGIFLSRSLQLVDSDELRVRLAQLDADAGSASETDKLINESKAIKLLLQAKDFYEKRNYELALSTASKASDVFPGHVPSELFLAKVQMKLGLSRQSLKTLEELVGKYPEDKLVNNTLIEAYVQTFKFNDAKNHIQNIANNAYRESYEYSSVTAKLHQKMGDSLQAMSWYKNSISLNPLNDADIFALAEILLKRANFDGARHLLNKCMELDPINPDYRLAYARLIYETQDDMAATGYLLSLQDDFKDNPKIMSEIAIFYYRSGKLKEFTDYKEKLEKSFSTDRSLYDFLIKAALLDDKFSEIPGLVEKLVKIEPGDLEAMMTAGRVLFDDNKLVEAAKWFVRVRERLPSYPKVLYYLAKIDFIAGDVEDARKKIHEDIKVNGENDEDLVFLAEIHTMKEEYVEAENLYKKAQKINPRSYDAIMGLADLSTKRNNHDLALDLYKRAMKLKSDEPLVHKKIGDVYRQLGQGTLAIEAYRMYLDMDPESPHKSNLEAYINLMN